MSDESGEEQNVMDKSELDEGILAGDTDDEASFTFGFYEQVDNLLLGYTDFDVHALLARVDVNNLDRAGVHGILETIGSMVGEEAQRVALIHILLERGDLKADFMSELINDEYSIGEVQISDPPSQGGEEE